MPDLKLLTSLLLIRLKKSKQQYNVASKSAYVITVELLDNVNIECTLTAESTGKITFHIHVPTTWFQNPDEYIILDSSA